MPKFQYKLIKSNIDASDAHFDNRLFKFEILPKKFDLRESGCMPAILDQGRLGSCGPTEISNALLFCINKQKLLDENVKAYQPSRLYIYYFSRMLDGSPMSEDTGISIKNGIKSVDYFGAPSEDLQPYDVTKFAYPPKSNAIDQAFSLKGRFKAVLINQNLIQIKQALVSGYPVIIGIKVYTSMESEKTMKTGIVPMPTPRDYLLGGHAVMLVGYDDDTKHFIMMNSWGTKVGKEGYFEIPYEYILDKNLCQELWCIQNTI